MRQLHHPRLRSWFTKTFPVLFYTLLIVLLFFYLRSIDFAKLKDVELSWPYLILSLLLGLAVRYWGAYIWFVLLKSLGAQELRNKRQLIYVYAKSWMGRYIPGTAPWILGKIYFASQHGISKNKLAVSSLLEGALQIVVTLTLSFFLLIFDARLDVVDESAKVFMVVVLVLGIISMVPAVFNRIIAMAYRLVRKKTFPAEHKADSKTVLQGALLYVVGAVINGIALFFMAKAVYPELAYANMLFVMAAGSLAGAMSMLAVFAPSGVGVREGIQLLLLSLIMPTEFALIITIASRVRGVVTDVLFFVLSKLFAVRPKK